MKKYYTLFLLVVVTTFSGCAVSSKNIINSLAVANGTVDLIVKDTKVALEQNVVSIEFAQKIANEAITARKALDAVYPYRLADVKTAKIYLDIAIPLVTTLQNDSTKGEVK